jgi:zinc and cadmium transporter
MQNISAILCLSLPILITGVLAFVVGIKRSNLRLILAFSAAYLFALSIIHMLPEAVTGSNAKQAGLFIVLGFCLQLVIDTFSTGIEHGHVHLHSSSCHSHLPYGIIIGLFLHSFLEGLPVYNVVEPGAPVNYGLIMGLGIHNVPITIAFVALLREHEQRKMRSGLLLVAFSLMAPLGYLFSYILHTIGLNNYEVYSKVAYAVVIGIFLHISTAILFESSDQHKYNLRKVLAMLGGIIVAYLMS